MDVWLKLKCLQDP